MIGWTDSKPVEIKRGIPILGLKWDMVIDISNNLFRDLVQKIPKNLNTFHEQLKSLNKSYPL